MIQVKRVYDPPDILDAARLGTITLIYSAHDQEHNSALALKVFLEERLKRPEQIRGQNILGE
jgi:uncharacterized protein YeaO (DUF488 family)